MILRPGYITREMLKDVLGEVEVDRTILSADSKEPPKAPGMKYRHYAPKGELTIVEGDPKKVAAYINEQTAAHKSRGEKTGNHEQTAQGSRTQGSQCVGILH